MKRICSLILSMAIIMTLCCPAFAASHENATNDDPNNETITTFIGDDGLLYDYVQYSDPVAYEYDGTTHTLLGTVRRHQSVSTYDNYHDWTTWSVIDYGITKSWVDMSNPYYVASVSRGETQTTSIEVEVTITPQAGIRIPAGSQSVVNNALKGDFSLGLTGKYKKTITITLTGPSDETNSNTRTFYYKKGFHKHSITIIEQEHSSWDGLISEKTYTDCYGFEPVEQHYSEDGNV